MSEKMMASQRPTKDPGAGTFDLGHFHIDMNTRTLCRDGAVVPLGMRAFDILAVLVSAAGRLVTKEELMDAVWPETIVEENNIYVHLSALRRALGANRDLIVTVPGRGYQLRQRPMEIQEPEVHASTAPRAGLPAHINGLTGRDANICQIRALLQTTHVLTLVGAGGIGKTSLAKEVARQIANERFATVFFVELATATTLDTVLRKIADACGLPSFNPEVAISQLIVALSGERTLLVLDNAEHVVGAVATIVDVLAAQSELLHVLVTSRESLRVMPETIYRVEPLEVPPPGSTGAEILRCSAVTLFLRRVNTLQRPLDALEEDVHLVGEICRNLDGLPLAIELAAARVAALGVAGIHRYLRDRFTLLTGGYRTALPRHQTLRATFDWSFSTLNSPNQLLFRRLSVFSGTFTFDAMCAVVCDEDYTVADAANGITDLVAKSLVNIEPDGPARKYRLSQSTRAYALEKLHAEGEQALIALRHARYFAGCSRPRSNSVIPRKRDREQWLDDARGAFEWALSERGDVRIGIELAADLTEAMLDAGLVTEGCLRAEQAVAALEELPPGSVDAATEMRVRALSRSRVPYAPGAVSRPAKSLNEALALTSASCDRLHDG